MSARVCGVVLLLAALSVLVHGPHGPTGVEAQQAASTEVTQGTLRVAAEPGQKLLEFPLKHTDVEAHVAGMVAHVTVTQHFTNPFEDPIEAVYVFPLPQNAAVNDMLMKIGGRTIRGLIQTREKARETYEQAIAEGKRASLLEQERPSIFTQTVGNILPGDDILITIKYVEDLTYDHGKYEFVFPMVVGPRFIPGAPVATPSDAGGWAPNTDRVPDASRITPPVLKPDERTGHDIDVALRINSGVPLRKLRSESHDVDITRQGSAEATVTLEAHDKIPNKDFELEWEITGEQPEIALLTHKGDMGGFFSMIVAPKADYTEEEITPKEMIFVLDCSGSMSGEPVEKGKEAMRRCVAGLNPNDTFQLIRFSIAASKFSPTPIPNTPENVKRGLKYIDEMSGSGGTQMIEGIKAALGYERDPERLRIVCFMTDGYIGNETEILAAIEERLGEARLFSFGVGTSVNRYLLDRMAEVGRGTVQYVNLGEDTETVVNRFYERIRRPYLTDIAIDWGGLDAEDVYPQRIPDLFSAQPVIVHGRYGDPGEGTIAVSGNIAGKPWSAEIDAAFPADGSGNEALASLWARQRIKDLMSQMYRAETPEVVEQVTAIALEFRLMSQYTSFVAVDEKVVVEGGQARTVHQPIPMPEGVSYEGVFGPPDRGEFRAAALYGRSAAVPLAALAAPGMMQPGMMAPPGPMGAKGDRGAPGAPGLLGPVALREQIDDLAEDVGQPSRRGLSPDLAQAYLPGFQAHGIAPVGWVLVAATDPEGGGETMLGLANLMASANAVIALPQSGAPWPVALAALKAVAESEAKPLPAVFLAGKKRVELDGEEREALRAYLKAGGFLIVICQSDTFRATIEDVLKEAVPELRLDGFPADLLHGEDMPYEVTADGGNGIVLEGKLVGVVFTGPYIESWGAGHSEENDPAFRLGMNILSYVLQRE